MRLIDADALKEAFSRDFQHFGKGSIPDYVVDWIKNEIEESPTIDAITLPCEVGDAVYCLIDKYILEGYVDCFGIYERNTIINVRVNGMGRSCTWGKTVFLTREEAEKSLERESE